jgi:hypothetical protein
MVSYDFELTIVSDEEMGRLFDEDDEMETVYEICDVRTMLKKGWGVGLEKFADAHLRDGTWYHSRFFRTGGGGPESGYIVTFKETEWGASISDIRMVNRSWSTTWKDTPVFAEYEIGSVTAKVYHTPLKEQTVIRIVTEPKK